MWFYITTFYFKFILIIMKILLKIFWNSCYHFVEKSILEKHGIIVNDVQNTWCGIYLISYGDWLSQIVTLDMKESVGGMV